MNSNNTSSENSHVILFDGVCNLCNGAVNFIIERDKKDLFTFSALQSNAGQAILKKLDLSTTDFDTFILLEGSQFFVKSTAALRVLKGLGGFWRLFYLFIFLPVPFRDMIYNFISRNRYKFFGTRNSCMMPSPGLLKKFLV